jgi:hypothetical protein
MRGSTLKNCIRLAANIICPFRLVIIRCSPYVLSGIPAVIVSDLQRAGLFPSAAITFTGRSICIWHALMLSAWPPTVTYFNRRLIENLAVKPTNAHYHRALRND